MDKELMHGQSFYEVLGVEQSASQNQVEDAYSAKREELDTLTDIDTAVIQKAITLLERAYGTLSDVDRRAEYDQTLEEISDSATADPAVSAIKEFHSPEETFPIDLDEEIELGTTIKEPIVKPRTPKLSGRLKATVTVPLSTITAAIRDDGDLSFLDAVEDNVERKKRPETPALARTRNDERVHSFASVSDTNENSRFQSNTPRAEEYRRERQPSLEIPRTAVARLTSQEEPEDRKTFVDFFLIFCAFILPLALLMLTLIQFVLPGS